MSLFPALITLVIVMMLAAVSARFAQDAGLSAAERMGNQLTRLQADVALQSASTKLPAQGITSTEVVVEQIAISGQAELSDLPMELQRMTVVSQGHQSRIRLQADYVLEGCESAYDDPCTPRVRRVAWRELPF